MGPKPKIAIVSLTCCEGCEFAILDLGRKYLRLLQEIDLAEHRLFEEVPESENYDICFVEGNPLTKDNIKLLKEVRKRTKILVALGNCAALGGIPEIKNYEDKKEMLKYVYEKARTIQNIPINELDKYVKVDYLIPGCPITGEEFLRITRDLINGKPPRIPQNPVCYECQVKEYECLLQRGEICLGPVILGGCEAICLKSRMPCWGCRGLLEDPEIEKLLKLLREKHSRDKINNVLEVFGLRDEIEERIQIKRLKKKDG